MRKAIRSALCLLLCLLMLPGVAAWAEDDAAILDPAELDALAEDFIAQRELEGKHISIGLCYTASGEYWYYNGDEWFYPASMYKVPLMMLLSEHIVAGDLSLDSDFYGKSVRDVQELILTYSNNDWAHTARKHLGGDEQWRADAMAYATLAESEYDPDYMDYCYFSNRYMTEVMYTLYSQRERFPNVTECLLQAEPNGYFRLELEGQYEIAQKYGSYTDGLGQQFHNNTGIIYSENPIIVTVMTMDVPSYEKVISDAAIMLLDYCQGKDAEYAELLKQQEELRQQQEAEEQAKLEQELSQLQEAAVQADQPGTEQQDAKKPQEDRASKPVTLIIFAAAVVVLIFIGSVAVSAQRRKKRRWADRRASDGHREGSRNYTPRH